LFGKLVRILHLREHPWPLAIGHLLLLGICRLLTAAISRTLQNFPIQRHMI
jgi:hypothetical protein